MLFLCGRNFSLYSGFLFLCVRDFCMVLLDCFLGFLAQCHFLAHLLRDIALDLVEAIAKDANDGRL